jgi:hypothetical protein
VAQVTIYLPDEIADRIKREARRVHKSLSAYVTELATRKLEPASKWPAGFARLYGSCKGELTEPEDLPPEDREPLG